MVIKMFRKFYPKRYSKSTYSINYRELYDEGYRGLIFDIDNTLVAHDADADEQAINFFKELKEIGFKTCLISNNREKRVKKFNEKINIPYIYDGRKPAKENYIKAMEIMGTDINNTVFIGDQLFTDILGANRVGMMNYAVKIISPKEKFKIVLKRIPEKIIYYFYFKELRKNKGR